MDEKLTEKEIREELKELNEELSVMMTPYQNEVYWDCVSSIKEFEHNIPHYFADESCGHDQLKASYEAIREGFKEFGEEISDYWEATEDIETDSTFLSDSDRELERLSDEEREEAYMDAKSNTESKLSDIADVLKESLEKIESRFDVSKDYENVSYYENLFSEKEDRKKELENELKSFEKDQKPLSLAEKNLMALRERIQNKEEVSHERA